MSDQNDQISLLGVSLDLGANNIGVAEGPKAFYDQKIVDKLKQVGFEVNDEGIIASIDRNNLDIGDPKQRYVEEILRVDQEVADRVEKIIRERRRPVVLGGDHSISLGTVSGASVALNGKLGLIYIDAHGDSNTNENTTTGNIHGMQLASLLGYGNKQLSQFKNKSKKIDKKNLIHIGGSDLDPPEIDLFADEHISAFTLKDILSDGIGDLLKQILKLNKQAKNIWVSLDLDSIDSFWAPGVGMPNTKGLTYREIATITEFIGQNVNLIGLDVVEHNPRVDIDHKTTDLGIELIAKLLGKDYDWYLGYMERNKV